MHSTGSVTLDGSGTTASNVGRKDDPMILTHMSRESGDTHYFWAACAILDRWDKK